MLGLLSLSIYLDLLELAEHGVAAQDLAEDRVLVVEVRRLTEQHAERGAAAVGVGHAPHAQDAARVRHRRELSGHSLSRLDIALGAERRGDRGAAHALDLCDEALVHAEDVVGVVAAQPEELEDVRDLVRVRVRVRARMRLRVKVKVEG